MSDLYEQLVQRTSASFKWSCTQQRSKVAWLVGAPRSGKSTLAKQIAQINSWAYVNYTCEPGYFDQLTSTITTYQPETFVAAVEEWCNTCTQSVLVLDEIDALLAVWSPQQRRSWASGLSTWQFPTNGLVLVSSFFDTFEIMRLLRDPRSEYCVSLAGVTQ